MTPDEQMVAIALAVTEQGGDQHLVEAATEGRGVMAMCTGNLTLTLGDAIGQAVAQ